jgi:peptidoglycan/LPS O-acetylase OafA/YrhL
VAAVVAYAALALSWIYVLAERQAGFGSDIAFAVFVAVGAGVHLTTGFVIGRWWAAVLPALAVLAAVPAGYPDSNKGEPWPIWLGLAWFIAPVGVVLIFLGVIARRWPERPAARGGAGEKPQPD